MFSSVGCRRPWDSFVSRLLLTYDQRKSQVKTFNPGTELGSLILEGLIDTTKYSSEPIWRPLYFKARQHRKLYLKEIEGGCRPFCQKRRQNIVPKAILFYFREIFCRILYMPKYLELISHIYRNKLANIFRNILNFAIYFIYFRRIFIHIFSKYIAEIY